MNDTRPNFSSILDEAPTEVKFPPPWPQGTYTAVVVSWQMVKSSKKGTDGVEFTLRPITAGEDVDESELTDFGPLGERTTRHTFWLTEASAVRLDQFHEHCGLDLSDPLSRRQRNDEVVNAQVGIFIKQEPTQDGERMRSFVDKTLPAE